MNRDKRIYISGPMSGVPREEYLRNFRQAEMELRMKGFNHIVNPINVWVCRWLWLYRLMEKVIGKENAYTLVLLYDLWLLSRCSTICMLDGWSASRGARIENYFAGLSNKFIITSLELI